MTIKQWRYYNLSVVSAQNKHNGNPSINIIGPNFLDMKHFLLQQAAINREQIDSLTSFFCNVEKVDTQTVPHYFYWCGGRIPGSTDIELPTSQLDAKIKTTRSTALDLLIKAAMANLVCVHYVINA